MIILTRRSFLAATTALAAAGLAPMRALGATPKTYRALLVACTAYPNLPEKNWLVGPKNDAALVRDFLLKGLPDTVKFAQEDMILLSDEVEGANGSPTHENITAGLAELAAKAEQGDFVYLHLSGHGAQQPEMQEGNETDGLDEIFLPNNINKWTDRSKGVPNALVDDEIGAAIDAIRSKGAFVWAVFDCCHSGTATRAVEVDDELERKVEFVDLIDPSVTEEGKKAYAGAQAKADAAASRDISADANQRKPAFSLPTGATPIGKGGLVAFYAAQTIETTPEMPLPKGAEDATRYGLFTYTIFSKIAENLNITYRQLGHAVLQQYSADGRTRPTPLFEGDLDARVFGTEKIDAAGQWPITVKNGAATIPAGLLHRLTVGSKLAVLLSPISDLADALGYVEVRSAKNLESQVRPVEFDDKPALKIADIPAGAYARVAELAVDYKLAVARPGKAEGLDAEIALVNAVLDELSQAKDKRFNIALVEPGQSADLRLAVMRENAVSNAAAGATDMPALWFLPASGDVTLKDGSRPPLVIIHTDDKPKLAGAVSDNLTTIFRATSLSKLAAASDYRPDEVSVEFRIKRKDDGTFVPLVAAEVPRVFPGDEVHVAAKNQSSRLVDINVLYVGSDYSVTHIVAERLVSGATLEEGLLAFTDTSFGMERMIAVLTEAPPESEMEDLSFLAQGGVPQARRGAGDQAGFSQMLTDIGLAPSTRSAMKLNDQGGSKGSVMIFPVETTRRPS
jgi:Caspase domain